jgi:vacuolar-type H+-ATPase subunit E/Vma4
MASEDVEGKIGQEILAAARAKVERAMKAAQREAEKATQHAHEEAKQIEQSILEAARRRADSRVKVIQAGVEPERRRLELSEREKVIAAIVADAKARLLKSDAGGYEKALVALAVEAAELLGGGHLIAHVSPEDEKRFGSALPQRARAAAGGLDVVIELRPSEEHIEGGIIMETPDGMRRVDNSVGTRVRRAYPELRRAIAEMLYKK